MKTAIVLATLAAGAAAFAPTPAAKQAFSLGERSDALRNEVGAVAPLGFFDPLGLCADGDQARFDHLREVEIRHGRVSMLAVVGWLTTAAGVRLPGMEETPNGFKALAMTGMPSNVAGTVPLTLMTVFILTAFMVDSTGENEFPGDYRNGFIDFGWDRFDDAMKLRKRNIELNNGRAAMMGILGIMVHEQLGNLNDIGLPQP